MTDPDDGAAIVRRRLQARRHLLGAVPAERAELQVGMTDGYRVSWQTTLGGSPPGIVYPNRTKWSGRPRRLRLQADLGRAFEPADRRRRSPRIIDIAPTVLSTLVSPIPRISMASRCSRGAARGLGLARRHWRWLGALCRSLGAGSAAPSARPPARTRREARKLWPSRAAERLAALQREAERSPRRSGRCSPMLRTLEIERQIRDPQS